MIGQRLLIIVLFCLILHESYVQVLSQKTFMDNPLNLQLYRTIRRGIYDIFGMYMILSLSLINNYYFEIGKFFFFVKSLTSWTSQWCPGFRSRLGRRSLKR